MPLSLACQGCNLLAWSTGACGSTIKSLEANAPCYLDLLLLSALPLQIKAEKAEKDVAEGRGEHTMFHGKEETDYQGGGAPLPGWLAGWLGVLPSCFSRLCGCCTMRSLYLCCGAGLPCDAAMAFSAARLVADGRAGETYPAPAGHLPSESSPPLELA